MARTEKVEISDTRLVEAAQDGDLEAFESLYKTNVGKVYGLCLRMVADPALAEDLTQEAFVRAWTRLGTFEGRSAFASWLHRIAVNTVLGHVRRHSRWSAKVVPLDDAPPVRVTGEAPQRSSRVDIQRALASLPPRARMVFVLYEIQGFRHHEIAELLDLASGTSKAHLHRARKLMREALEQ